MYLSRCSSCVYSRQEFQTTREAKRRFVAAYSMMLDFYGVKLLDKNGNVTRASNWEQRFQHLNESVSLVTSCLLEKPLLKKGFCKKINAH